MTRFSERFGYGAPEAEIRIRDDAPDEMRSVLLDIAYENGFRPGAMRNLLCRVLRKKADRDNWSEYPNIENECQQLIAACNWYDVYNAIEEIYSALQKPAYYDHNHGPGYAAGNFSDEINRYFKREGIGWQLVDGIVEVRGEESFEIALNEAHSELSAKDLNTAGSELHEAILDLSRRPEPDITGAIQHAMTALECISREKCGDVKSTLGELIKKHTDLFPRPIDQVVEKLWGYSSESGRHLKEGKPPSFEEAELVVGLCASLCRYLARKIP